MNTLPHGFAEMREDKKQDVIDKIGHAVNHLEYNDLCNLEFILNNINYFSNMITKIKYEME